MNLIMKIILSSESMTMSVIRAVLVAFAGWLGNKGLVDGSDGTALVAALMAVVTVLWGIVAKRNAKLASADLVAQNMAPKAGPPTNNGGRPCVSMLLLLNALPLYALLCTGCASVLVNRQLQKNDALQARLLAGPDGQVVGATVGVDLLSLDTIGEHPWYSLAALGVDAALGVGTYALGKNQGWWGGDGNGNSSSSSTSIDNRPYTVNGHQVTVSGDGNTVSVGDPFTSSTVTP